MYIHIILQEQHTQSVGDKNGIIFLTKHIVELHQIYDCPIEVLIFGIGWNNDKSELIFQYYLTHANNMI